MAVGALAPAAPPSLNATPSTVAMRLARGETAHVVFYGTSLTRFGKWTDQVSNVLRRRYPGRLIVTNSGGSGMNSNWGVANLRRKVLSRNPDAVFLEFAINDSVARFHLPIYRARKNWSVMIDRIRKQRPDAEIVLLVTNPVIDRPWGDRGYRPQLRAYYQMVRRLAMEKQCRLVDAEAGWNQVLARGGKQAYRTFVPDGVHPNEEGCRRLMLPKLVEALQVPTVDRWVAKQPRYDVLVYGDGPEAVNVAVGIKDAGRKVLLVTPPANTREANSGSERPNLARAGSTSESLLDPQFARYLRQCRLQNHRVPHVIARAAPADAVRTSTMGGTLLRTEDGRSFRAREVLDISPDRGLTPKSETFHRRSVRDVREVALLTAFLKPRKGASTSLMAKL